MAATLTQTFEQRMGALEKANAIRLARANLKRDIAAGRKDLRAIILDPPEYAAGMKLIALLAAVPGVGHQKGERWLRECGYASSWVTVGGFTARQRSMLMPMLNRHAHTSVRFQRAQARAGLEAAA